MKLSISRSLVAGLVIGCGAFILASGPAAAGTCSSPGYQEFDFSQGRWDLDARDGRTSGTSSMAAGGSCVENAGNEILAGRWQRTSAGDSSLLITPAGSAVSQAAVFDASAHTRDRAPRSHGSWRVRDRAGGEIWTRTAPR